jgi:phosphohistidine phosphatase
VRQLLLLRHAKSSWDDPRLGDHDRPLAPRGEEAARRVAVHLESAGIRPRLVLCSSARRARDTLAALLALLGDAPVQVDADLYGADSSEILEMLRRVGSDVESVMIVGHNPGLEELALDLAGDGDPTALERLRTKYPTGALAVLQLATDWAALDAGTAYLSDLVLPRRLPPTS